MNRTPRFAFIGVAALAVVAGSITLAQSSKDDKPDMPLPPGWTEEDMMACAKAGTPGEMHEHLAKSAGTWKTESRMWMAPDTEPMRSEGTMTATPILGGRFVKSEMKGEMPGMGMYHGNGIYGYDNVAEEFQCSWFDNHSTGIMRGTGELSSDGRTLTWEFTYNCPIREKPAKMREVERITGENTRTLTMFGTDPKSGKEFKMMEIEMTRQSD